MSVMGTHIAQLVPRVATLRAGSFKDTVIVTVLVTPSGHGDLHLGTGRKSLRQTCTHQ